MSVTEERDGGGSNPTALGCSDTLLAEEPLQQVELPPKQSNDSSTTDSILTLVYAFALIFYSYLTLIQSKEAFGSLEFFCRAMVSHEPQ